MIQQNDSQINIPQLKFRNQYEKAPIVQTKSSKRFYSPRYISRKTQNQKKHFKSPNHRPKQEEKHELFKYLSPKKLNKNQEYSEIDSIQKNNCLSQQIFESSISQIGNSFYTQQLSNANSNWLQRTNNDVLVYQFSTNKQKNQWKEQQNETTSDKIASDKLIYDQVIKSYQISNQILKQQNQQLKNQSQFQKIQIKQKTLQALQSKNTLQKLQVQNLLLKQQNKQFTQTIRNYQLKIQELTKSLQSRTQQRTQIKQINSCLQDIILQLNQKLGEQKLQRNSFQNYLQQLNQERDNLCNQMRQYKSAITYYQQELRKSQVTVIKLKNTIQVQNGANLQKQKNTSLTKFQTELSYLVQLIKEERQTNQSLIQQLKYRDISLTILKKKQLQIQCKQKQIKKLKIKNRKLMDRVQLLLQQKQRWTQKRVTGRSSSHNKSEPKNAQKPDRFNSRQGSLKVKVKQDKIRNNLMYSSRTQNSEDEISLELSPFKE